MRLIDVDKLLNDICDKGLAFDALMILISEQPTADAVEVVRCGNCKWFNPINNGDHGYCGTPFHGREVYEDDYCSDGERKEE